VKILQTQTNYIQSAATALFNQSIMHIYAIQEVPCFI